MGRPLRSPPPTSSIARLLDLDIAARAVGAPAQRGQDEPNEAPERVTANRAPSRGARTFAGETPSIKRELVLTRSADETLTRFVAAMRIATGTRLTTSHAVRAILKAIALQLDLIERESLRMGPMRLPSNARGREYERDRFEARIADAVLVAMRSGGPGDEGDR